MLLLEVIIYKSIEIFVAQFFAVPVSFKEIYENGPNFTGSY